MNAQTGNYTLVLGDAGKLITLTNAGNITLTIPDNANVAFSANVELDFFNLGGGGNVTITPMAGVTVHSADSSFGLGQNCGASIKKIATNEWILAGRLS